MGLDIAQADDQASFIPKQFPIPKNCVPINEIFTPAVQKTIALMNILFDWRTL